MRPEHQTPPLTRSARRLGAFPVIRDACHSTRRELATDAGITAVVAG
jgi:hypothetical protein